MSDNKCGVEAVPSILKCNRKRKAAENNLNELFEPKINFENANNSENGINLKYNIDILRNQLSSLRNELATFKMARLENQELSEKTSKLKETIISYVKHNNQTEANLNAKIQKLMEIDVKPEKHLYHLPSDICEIVFGYLSLDEIIALSSVCKGFQKIVQAIKHSFDFSHHYSLNIDYLLNYTLSTTCKSINLNYCYWIKSNEILHIISKTKLDHLHIIECKVNKYSIDAIGDHRLTSLSITYTEKWQFYFKPNHRNYTDKRAFKTLKSLTIFYKKSHLLPGRTVFYEIYKNGILYSCKKLEHFKIFDCKSRLYISDHGLPEFPSRGHSPWPELKSLIIKINNLKYEPDIANFVRLILREKVIPLEYVDFGYQTGYLFQNNILQGEPILWHKSPLLLSCINTDFKYWLKFPQVKDLIRKPNQTKITTENIDLNGFSKFFRRIVSNSGKTLKEIRINHSDIFKNFYNVYLNGILHIAINCPQITILDISGHEQEENDDYDEHISFNTFQKHQAILEAIANLKNLEKLVISPQLLHCLYLDSNGDEKTQAVPFVKVAKGCKQLTELRIEYIKKKFIRNCEVHMDTLNDIAHCIKLRVLSLVNFLIDDMVDEEDSFAFPILTFTRNCQQLQELHLCKLKNSINIMFKGPLEFSLNLAKSIKIISISKFAILSITKPFIDSLSLCENLEKIYLDKIKIKPEDCVKLAEAFLKLKNLQVVIIGSGLKRSTDKAMDLILDRIAKERPAFFCSMSEKRCILLKSLPISHFDLISPIEEMY